MCTRRPAYLADLVGRFEAEETASVPRSNTASVPRSTTASVPHSTPPRTTAAVAHGTLPQQYNTARTPPHHLPSPFPLLPRPLLKTESRLLPPSSCRYLACEVERRDDILVPEQVLARVEGQRVDGIELRDAPL
eukprot:3603644-Rhodomonas_salina.1